MDLENCGGISVLLCETRNFYFLVDQIQNTEIQIQFVFISCFSEDSIELPVDERRSPDTEDVQLGELEHLTDANGAEKE